MEKISYFGLVISKDKLKVNASKIINYNNWPRPINKNNLSCLRGFLNFYSNYIPILNDKLDKFTEGEWTKEKEKIYQEIFQNLIKSEMYFPTHKLPLIVNTDASLLNIAMNVFQEDNGTKKNVFNFSKRYPLNINHSIPLKEVNAGTYFFESKRHFFQGFKIYWNLDAKSIALVKESLNNEKSPNRIDRRLVDSLFRISDLDITIKSIPRTENVVTDTLTHLKKS